MKERPILFSGPMVRAILDGRKTQTRRMVKPQPRVIGDGVPYGGTELTGVPVCPYGVVGNRLWVRETWMEGREDGGNGHGKPYYKATFGNVPEDLRWRPSIHMPRWASRITLEITGIRVERLQEITEEDAEKEGVVAEPVFDTVSPQGWMSWTASFARLWDSIYGNWNANPFVWVVEFRRVQP